MTSSRLFFYTVVVTPGAVLMALEIVSSRILAPQFGSSVYVWGSIIGVFLAAMSIGYFGGGRLADRQPSLASLGRLVLAAAAFQAVVLLTGVPVVAKLGELTRGSPAGTLLATSVLFGPPTMFLAAVSPYAVKLATRDLQLLGGTAGHLYALSTGGSLVGTLGATFVLIPYLDLESILRLLLAITVVTAGAAMATAARSERLGLALAASLLLLAAVPGTLTREAGLELLADRITPYQTLRVTESDGVRFLHSDGTVHGAVTLDGEPWLPYTHQAPTALLLKEDLSSFLVLGMGSAGVGTVLKRRLPALSIDYVDIDPAIPRLAREFLLFEDGDGTAVHVDDGRRFLAGRPDARWDYIYTDVYVGSAIPFHLATVEFFREARSHLSPGGVFGLNLISSLENPFAKSMLRSLASVFRKLYVFIVPGGNYLLLATDRPDAPGGREELLAAARRLDAQAALEPSAATPSVATPSVATPSVATPSLEKMASYYHDLDVDLTEALILTDAYAPVNHLIRLEGGSLPDLGLDGGDAQR